MRLILAAVDGSPTARRAAEVAAELAQATGASLHLVTAFEHGPPVRLGGGADGALDVGPLERAETMVATLAADLRPHGPEITTAAVTGRPADAVCDEARRVDADLIVVGNRRVRGMARVLGAVATKVLQSSPCDVYVAHTT